MPTRSELLVGWLVLFGVSLVLLACVMVVAWWQRNRTRRDTPPGEHQEVARHAAEVAARAVDAAARASEARQEAAATEQERATAWQEREQARQAHDDAARAYQQQVEQRAAHSADTDGQRELAHAAFSAYRRGELSSDEFWWVWRLGNGWDPQLERREQELRRLRGAFREADQRYQAAAQRARDCAQRADVTEVEARALIEETAESAREADVTP